MPATRCHRIAVIMCTRIGECKVLNSDLPLYWRGDGNRIFRSFDLGFKIEELEKMFQEELVLVKGVHTGKYCLDIPDTELKSCKIHHHVTEGYISLKGPECDYCKETEYCYRDNPLKDYLPYCFCAGESQFCVPYGITKGGLLISEETAGIEETDLLCILSMGKYVMEVPASPLHLGLLELKCICLL